MENREPFNLNVWRNDIDFPVETRAGTRVTGIHEAACKKTGRKIVRGYIRNRLIEWWENGRFHDKIDTKVDLFFSKEEHENMEPILFVNVYESDGETYAGDHVYEDLESAENSNEQFYAKKIGTYALIKIV